MKLIELSMENFRSYTEKKPIKFPTTDEKPLVTFVGDNGAGKTTIFLAIIWALYGEIAIRAYAQNRPMDPQAPRTNFDLLNTEVAGTSPKPFMRVTLIFEHNSKKYILWRRISSSRALPLSNRDLIGEELELKEIGKPARESFPQGVIDDILPFEASQFFLFDGEEVRRYSGGKAKETQEAIELVLGIPEIREARDDMTRIQRRLLERLREEPNISENMKNISEGLEIAIKDERTYDDVLEAKRKELTSVEAELQQAQLRREELKEIAEENAKLQKILAEKKATDESIIENEKRRNELIERLPYFLIIPQVRETLARFKKISGTDDLTSRIRNLAVRMEMIDELLNSTTNKCLCGSILDDAHKRHLLLARKALETESKELNLRASKKTIPPVEDIQYVLGRLEGVNVDFKQLDRTINGLKVSSMELDDARLALQEKIKGSDVREAVKVQTLIEQLSVRKGKLNAEIESAGMNYSQALTKKEKLRGLLKAAHNELGTMSAVSVNQQSAAKLVDALSWIIEELSSKKKKMIIDNASKFFETVSKGAGWGGIQIENDYSIWLLDAKGRRTIPAEGWKELVALSLIYGLNKAANYEAPVVMDFVLGRLDSSRQISVVNNLADFAKQIVILFLDTEIQTERVKERLSSLSAVQYEIERHSSDGGSVIKEIKQ